MIYIDANIFIYAYFKIKKGKKLSDKIKWFKQQAKEIIREINNEVGDYCISIIQLSEIVNILKRLMPWSELQKLIMGIISNNSIEIVEISKLLYINAVEKILKYNMDPNDISAYLIMKIKKINTIYTFDRHFRELPDIICLPEIPNKFD